MEHVYPADYHKETCTDQPDHYYVWPTNPGAHAWSHDHALQITSAEGCADHSDPVDQPGGKFHRSWRSRKRDMRDLCSDLICPPCWTIDKTRSLKVLEGWEICTTNNKRMPCECVEHFLAVYLVPTWYISTEHLRKRAIRKAGCDLQECKVFGSRYYAKFNVGRTHSWVRNSAWKTFLFLIRCPVVPVLTTAVLLVWTPCPSVAGLLLVPFNLLHRPTTFFFVSVGLQQYQVDHYSTISGTRYPHSSRSQ